MPRNRIFAFLSITVLLGGCRSTQLAPHHPTAQLGTVAPAYAVGEELSPGITAIERIPVAVLDNSGSTALHRQDPCRSIPTTAVTPAGFPANPFQSTKYGCDWFDPAGFWLRIGGYAEPSDMAHEVADHIDMANGRSVDNLIHLAWLLIDAHYAIERILRSDPSSTCYITLDLRSSWSAFVAVYAVDAANGKPLSISPGDSLAKFCPRARTVAQHFFREVLDPLDPPGAGIFPTR